MVSINTYNTHTHRHTDNEMMIISSWTIHRIWWSIFFLFLFCLIHSNFVFHFRLMNDEHNFCSGLYTFVYHFKTKCVCVCAGVKINKLVKNRQMVRIFCFFLCKIEYINTYIKKTKNGYNFKQTNE